MNGKNDQKVNGISGQQARYSRLPDSVLFDATLSFAARCVYAVIAGAVFQGNVARIGQRLIAKRLGCHQETVGKALAELAGRKHLTVTGEGKSRRVYTLHSPVFAQKQRAGVKEIVSGPRGSRLVSVGVA